MLIRDVTLRGASGAYTLQIGTNALCRLEEYTGKSFSEVLTELQSENPRLTLIRHFVKATLVAPADATLEQVGAIIDDVGGVDALALAIGQAEPLLPETTPLEADPSDPPVAAAPVAVAPAPARRPGPRAARTRAHA